MTYPEKLKQKVLDNWRIIGFERALDAFYIVNGHVYRINRMTLSRWIKKEKEQRKLEQMVDPVTDPAIQFALRTALSAYKNKKHRFKKRWRDLYYY